MEMTTATDGQRPGSGCSCFGDRAGFAWQRARGSGCAAHEAAACTSVRVKPGPETPAVDVSRSRDGQKVRWIMNSDRMGSPGGHVCEALCGLHSVFCSQSAQRRSLTGRAHVLAWGTPRNARFALDAQGGVMAACMVGIRQEGIKSLPDGTVRGGTRCAKREQLP